MESAEAAEESVNLEVIWNGVIDGQGGEFLQPSLRALARDRPDLIVQANKRQNFSALVAQSLQAQGRQDWYAPKQIEEASGLSNRHVHQGLYCLIRMGKIEKQGNAYRWKR